MTDKDWTLMLVTFVIGSLVVTFRDTDAVGK